MSQSLFYLTTALHASGVTITHLQEHIKFKNAFNFTGQHNLYYLNTIKK
jgi:hypothetical protein